MIGYPTQSQSARVATIQSSRLSQLYPHSAAMEVLQDCPEPGCWWQKPDIARRVIAFLPSRDVLACDLVCKDWAALKVPLSEAVTLDGADLNNPAAAAWLKRNLPRLQHIILRTDDAAATIRLYDAKALQRLEVADCSTLQQLPTGLGQLPQLTSLHFNRCPLLQKLPGDLAGMTNIQQLSVRGTPTSLAMLPDSIAALGELQDLRLHGCHLLQEVPDAIGSLTALTRLELDTDCDSPELLPTLQLPAHLRQISSSIEQLTSLQHITIRGANQLQELPDVLAAFGILRELKLVGLHSIATLPDSIGALTSLTWLLIHGANALEVLPDSLGGLGSLKNLSISHCHKLRAIPTTIAELDTLEHLELGCHSLMEALPESLGGLSALTHLSIETASLSHLPASIGNLASLRELIFSYCHCLQVLPDSIGQLRSLELLVIDTCMHLAALPGSITHLSNLRELRIHNAEAWPVQLPSLPDSIGTLPMLQKLSLTTQHPPDDGVLPSLPNSLALSTSLKEIHWGHLRLQRA